MPPPPHSGRVALIAAALFAVLALPQTAIARESKVITVLPTTLIQMAGSDIYPTPKSVSCPSGVKTKKGGTFECTITLANGAIRTVTMHMTNSSGAVHVSDKDIHATG